LEKNANTAKVIAKVLNISDQDIDKGIMHYRPQSHRMAVIKHKSGAIIVDDTYNSNSEALIASVSYFSSISKNRKKILVVGDMLELGGLDVSEHKRVGVFVRKAGFEKVYGVGKLVKHITSEVKTIDELVVELKKYLKPKYSILFKASRSIGLDRLVDKLL
jgi:UDP-N-acetylmuramoyl-tripeptide--D-alanyl-D-alanine ligase